VLHRASQELLAMTIQSAISNGAAPQPAAAQGPGRRATPQPAASFADRLTELLIKQRWALVVPVVLPISKAYDLYWHARHVYLRAFRGAAEQHGARVAHVARQIAEWRERGRPGLLHTSRKSWQSVAVRAIEYKKKSQSGIDVELHDILELDLERRVVKVEPRVNMAQLTRKLAPLGLTIPVVPELDDLTAGGLFLGYGIESSAHKYGLFADTVSAAEVVLADGRVVRASRSENADLFYSLPWSYGAHGMLTALELPVIPAKPYVRLSYLPVRGFDDMTEQFTKLVCAEQPPEFVDALLFDAQHGVIIHGDFADLPAGERPNRIGRFYKPWFHKHAERQAARGGASEYVPLRDYYHRYTRSLYWHGELLVPFGNHPLFRYTLGWLMPPKVSVLRLVQSERVRKYRDARNVVQDALVPIRLLRESLELFQREFECYPLWMCGHKTLRTEPQGMIGPSLPDVREEMFVDVGAWQVPGFVKRGEPWDGHRAVRNMEAWLRANHGYQCLYAVTEQSENEFWQMFDRTLYERVRERYGGAGAFMDVFDKVRRRD
jgi:delta24-sterol reductase